MEIQVNYIRAGPSIVKQEIIENCEYTEHLNPEHQNSAEHKDIKLENTTEHFNVQTFIKLENSEQKNNEHVVAEHYNEHYEHLKHDGIDEYIGVEHTEHINIEPMEHINVGTDEHSIKLEAEVSLLVLYIDENLEFIFIKGSGNCVFIPF
jgi:hypothetical protein